jgi:hypothetical protein
MRWLLRTTTNAPLRLSPQPKLIPLITFSLALGPGGGFGSNTRARTLPIASVFPSLSFPLLAALACPSISRTNRFAHFEIRRNCSTKDVVDIYISRRRFTMYHVPRQHPCIYRRYTCAHASFPYISGCIEFTLAFQNPGVGLRWYSHRLVQGIINIHKIRSPILKFSTSVQLYPSRQAFHQPDNPPSQFPCQA